MPGPWDTDPIIGQAGTAPWASDPIVGGKKTFDIDWSKPTTDVRAAIAALPEADRSDAIEQWAEAAVAKERSGPTTLSNNPIAEGVRHFGRGTLVGSFLDEIDAKGNQAIYSLTGGTFGAPEEEALAYNRARSRAEDEAHPVAGTVAKLAGGLASGAPIAKAVVGGAKSTLGKIGASGLAGGTAAGVYGFGEGEGGDGTLPEQATNRLASAGGAAPYGLALGAGLPVAGKAVGGLLQKGADALPGLKARLPISKVSNPDNVADQWLAAKLRRAGQSPESIADDFAEGEYASRLNSNSKLGKKGVNQDNALLPEAIADTSDTMQRLTGSVYRTGNEAAEVVKTRLEGRQKGPENFYAPRDDAAPQGQLERILDSLDRALLLRTKGTARATEREIVAAQKTEGDKLYHAARKNSEPFDLAEPLAAFRANIENYPPDFANRLAAAMQLFIRPQQVKGGVTLTKPVDNITLFDNAKKSLDDLIEAAKRSGEGNLARELKVFKDSLLAKVHEGGKNKTYQQARDTWGSAAENREAIDLGRKALRENSEVSVEQFNELNPAQQKLFRIGLRESARNAAGQMRAGHDATKLFDTRRAQELLSVVIPRTKDEAGVFADRPQRFGEIMRREGRMGETNKKVLGNSATAQRQQDDAEFAADTLSTIITSGRSALNYGLEVIGAGLQKAFGYRRDVALALAKRLTETDPVKRAQVLQDIAKRMGPSQFAEFARGLGDAASLGATPPMLSGTEPAKQR